MVEPSIVKDNKSDTIKVQPMVEPSIVKDNKSDTI